MSFANGTSPNAAPQLVSASAWRFPRLRVVGATLNGINVLPAPTLWDFNSLGLAVCLSANAQSVPVGSTIDVVLDVGDQRVTLPIVVDSVAPIYGSYIVARGIAVNVSPTNANFKRRANLRFNVGATFPVTCTFTNELDRSDPVLCRVVDVSFGGIGLQTSFRNRALFPGLAAAATIRTPFDGECKSHIRIRSVHALEGSQSGLRLHCECDISSPRQRQALQRHITRFGTEPLKLKLQEKFVPTKFAPLVEHHEATPREWTTTNVGSAYLPDDYSCANRVPTGGFGVVGTLGGIVVSKYWVSETETVQGRRFRVSSSEFAEGTSAEECERAGRAFLYQLTAKYQTSRLAEAETGFALTLQQRLLRRYRLALREPPGGARLRSRSEPSWQVRTQRTRDVEWDRYAEAYDVMCEVNPAYQENLRRFVDWLRRSDLPDTPRICDVGAGTGNFVLEIASRYPRATVVHLDQDPGMNKTAARKYRSRGFDNIQFEHSSIQEAYFEPESFDLVVLVNALYAFSDPFDALRRINKWLSRRGRLYLIDLGRLMNVTDWARYIIGSSVRSTGVAKTVSSFVRGRQAITQNRSIRLNQDKGRYWVHTADQFKDALEHAGFSIEEQGTCYRDACDYAICKRSPNDA